ncbi:hypothetical protein JCM3765_000563 [Sporobolomyces pararoseus]
MWDSRYPSNHPLSRRSPLSSSSSSESDQLSTLAVQPPTVSPHSNTSRQLPNTSSGTCQASLSVIIDGPVVDREKQEASTTTTESILLLPPPASSPLGCTSSRSSPPLTTTSPSSGVTTSNTSTVHQSEESNAPRKRINSSPRISPKAIYSIHAPEGYRPNSRPNSPTPTSTETPPPLLYRLPSTPHSNQSNSSNPRLDSNFRNEERRTVTVLGGGGGVISNSEIIDLLSDHDPPFPPPPDPLSTSSSSPTSTRIGTLPVQEEGGIVETNIGNLIDFEVEILDDSERNLNSSRPVHQQAHYKPPPDLHKDKNVEKKKGEEEKKRKEVIIHGSNGEEKKTLLMLEESIQEIIALEAEIEIIKSRTEYDLQQVKIEYERKLEKEKKEVERLKKENEELRKKEKGKEKIEEPISSEEEFVYESVEKREEKVELKVGVEEIGRIKFEDRENQVGFDRLRSREELLELARSPLVRECAEVYVKGVLPTQMDAKSLQSQSKPLAGTVRPQKSLVWNGGARSYSTPQIRQMEGLMYMNEKLRRELKEAQDTIEELMKELEGGDEKQENWSSPKSTNGGWD